MKQYEELLRTTAALENVYKKVKKDANNLTSNQNTVLRESEIARREIEELRNESELKKVSTNEMEASLRRRLTNMET